MDQTGNNVHLTLRVFNELSEEARQLTEESGQYFIQGAESLSIVPSRYSLLPSHDKVEQQQVQAMEPPVVDPVRAPVDPVFVAPSAPYIEPVMAQPIVSEPNVEMKVAPAVTPAPAPQEAISVERAELMRAARSLFRERGYVAVKLEEIADLADLSPRTLYAYFRTKNDLLLAVIISDFEVELAKGRKIVEGPIVDAKTAIDQLTSCHFPLGNDGPTSEMWRFAIAAFFSDPMSHFAREYQRCLDMVRQRYSELIRRLQSEDALPRALDADELAYILYSSATMSFLEHIHDNNAEFGILEDKLSKVSVRIVEWASFHPATAVPKDTSSSSDQSQ